MRNDKSNVRTVKRKMSKCKDICRTYNDIQFSYADLLGFRLRYLQHLSVSFSMYY